jgi:two-component system heavy metal sensor histidine kinase CusS
VSNEGPPIAPEYRERVFERSFRVDESRYGSASNSGLGLAIVRSIMDLHHGTAAVVSGTRQQTTFKLWFPGESERMR